MVSMKYTIKSNSKRLNQKRLPYGKLRAGRVLLKLEKEYKKTKVLSARRSRDSMGLAGSKQHLTSGSSSRSQFRVYGFLSAYPTLHEMTPDFRRRLDYLYDVVSA